MHWVRLLSIHLFPFFIFLLTTHTTKGGDKYLFWIRWPSTSPSMEKKQKTFANESLLVSTTLTLQWC
jgi:hypothetical protein